MSLLILQILQILSDLPKLKLAHDFIHIVSVHSLVIAHAACDFSLYQSLL